MALLASKTQATRIDKYTLAPFSNVEHSANEVGETGAR